MDHRGAAGTSPASSPHTVFLENGIRLTFEINTEATGAGENAQAEQAGDEGSQASKDTAAVADGAAGSGAEDGGKTPNGGGDAKTGGDLPETGGMSPTALLVVGTVLLLMGSTGLSAAVCRRSASRG